MLSVLNPKVVWGRQLSERVCEVYEGGRRPLWRSAATRSRNVSQYPLSVLRCFEWHEKLLGSSLDFSPEERKELELEDLLRTTVSCCLVGPEFRTSLTVEVSGGPENRYYWRWNLIG